MSSGVDVDMGKFLPSTIQSGHCCKVSLRDSESAPSYRNDAGRFDRLDADQNGVQIGHTGANMWWVWYKPLWGPLLVA